MAPLPPRLAQMLLRWTLPPDDFEVISGDLEEALDAMASSRPGVRLWYWRHVASIVCSRVRAATGGSADPHRTRVMMAFRQDLAYALRSLRKQPGFAAMAVVMLAVPSMRLLIALLYQVRPDDPQVLARLSLALFTVAVLAGYVPARRATHVDPLTTLRSE